MRYSRLVPLTVLVVSALLWACTPAAKPKPTAPAPEYEPGRTWVGTGASAHPVSS